METVPSQRNDELTPDESNLEVSPLPSRNNEHTSMMDSRSCQHSSSDTEENTSITDQLDGKLKRKVGKAFKAFASSNSYPEEYDNILSRPELEEKLIKAALDGDIDTVEQLLDDEVNIETISNEAGMEGLTPLLAASWGGQDKVVKLLIEKKANRKAIANGFSAVHYAALGGHVGVLQVLWDIGSNIKCITPDGSSPLHIAADNGNFEAVKWLVDKGALLNSKDKKGCIPEELAIDSGYKYVAAFLHEKNEELRMNDLTEKKTLGKGSYGEVFLVKRNGKPLVLKSVSLSRLQTTKKKDYALQEIKLLKSLSHPYIVSYVGGGCRGDFIYILMEFCSGGDLAKKIHKQREKNEPFNEDQVLNWALRLGIAVKYIHNRKILHRDIKPQNIFLTGENVIKLGDFGLSKVLTDESKACTSIGSPAYMSSEVFKGQPYDAAADMWSFGCVMFEMAALKMAYPHKKLDMPHFSQRYKDIVMSLLQRDPKKRISVDSLLKLPIFHDILEKQLPEKEHHISELKDEIDSLTYTIEGYIQETENREATVHELRKENGDSLIKVDTVDSDE